MTTTFGTGSGRDRDVAKIRNANKAAAIGSLLLGELDSWIDFLAPDTADLIGMPRRNLKSGREDVKARMGPEIRKFCERNFEGMDQRALIALYEEVKATRGLELPLHEFERRFAKVRDRVLNGTRRHTTVVISLWGLQFRSAEDELTKDILEALRIARLADDTNDTFIRLSQAELRARSTEIAAVQRELNFAARSAVIAVFNLAEAYLNGVAWDFAQQGGTATLSSGDRKLIDDAGGSLRKRFERYPEIVTRRPLWSKDDQGLEALLGIIKPYRDALVHPSPFLSPARFGGVDKLRLFHFVDRGTATAAAAALATVVERMESHIYPKDRTRPHWIADLRACTNRP